MSETLQKNSRRGFVFTIDASLSLMLLVLTLVTITFLSVQAEDNPYVKVHTSRVGKDALAVLERQEMLESANKTLIDNALNYTLPMGVGAHIQVYTYYFEGGSFNLLNISDYGLAVPNNSSTFGARQDYVQIRHGIVTNYSIARMTIWQR